MYYANLEKLGIITTVTMNDTPSDQIQSELENFRNQWRAEVSARTKNPAPAPASTSVSGSQAGALRKHDPTPSSTSSSSHRKAAPPTRSLGHHHRQSEDGDDDEDSYVPGPSFDDAAVEKTGRRLDDGGSGGEQSRDKGKGADREPAPAVPPQSAIDFYEAAVEKETTGKLGDSLQLYRKAFRMDSHVDQIYRNKHFASAWRTKPPPPQSSSSSSGTGKNQPQAPAPAVVPVPAPAATTPAPSIPELIASFAGAAIEGVPAEVEGTPEPPCPIAALPGEILVHILRDVAVADVGDFARLSRVCRRLAYLVATEEAIWRRVCLGPEFGFLAMHHRFQRGVAWEDLPLSLPIGLGSSPDDPGPPPGAENLVLVGSTTEEEQRQRLQEASEQRKLAASTALLRSGAYAGSWRGMFRSRPRVRFNGCYISTVNYIRAGQSSAHQIAWNTPVHIVTYYRYLRLFRDGAALSLLTTDEPAAVVPHLTREAADLHRGGAAPHLPSAVVANALRGRWRLSGVDSLGDGDNGPLTTEGGGGGADGNPIAATATDLGVHEAEGDLFVETEGVGPKYLYRMDLSLGHAGKSVGGGARNTKLLWRGFWSYNRLTDDWAEFGLRNYKPFFFSRVRSYGLGE